MENMCRRCQIATLEILTWIDFDIDTGCWHFLPQAPAGAEDGARYTAWTAWRCGDLLSADAVEAKGYPSCAYFGDCVNPEHYYAAMQVRSQRDFLTLSVGA